MPAHVPQPGVARHRRHPRAGPVPARRGRLNDKQRNFRVFGPDETLSNGLEALFEATDAAMGCQHRCPATSSSRPRGRVMDSMLSEHQCEGWLEGYLLTGRHGLFNCYEAFIHIVDSMFNQHAKWLKVTAGLPWRTPDRLAELPAGLACLAPGPQRLHPPGSGLHRPRGEQEGRGGAGLPAAGCQLPAVGDGPLPAQPQLRQRGDRRQASGAAVAVDGRRPSSIAARASASGRGPATTRSRTHRMW